MTHYVFATGPRTAAHSHLIRSLNDIIILRYWMQHSFVLLSIEETDLILVILCSVYEKGEKHDYFKQQLTRLH